MANGDRLSGDTTAMNIYRYIKLISSPSELEGLKGDHFTGLSPKVFFQRPLVDDKLPLSGFKPNPRNGSLSFACSIDWFCHFLLLICELLE